MNTCCWLVAGCQLFHDELHLVSTSHQYQYLSDHHYQLIWLMWSESLFFPSSNHRSSVRPPLTQNLISWSHIKFTNHPTIPGSAWQTEISFVCKTLDLGWGTMAWLDRRDVQIAVLLEILEIPPETCSQRIKRTCNPSFSLLSSPLSGFLYEICAFAVPVLSFFANMSCSLA